MAWALAMIYGAAALWLDQRPASAGGGPYDAVVVLGCGVRPDGSASAALSRRASLAADLWNEGLAETLILTGGVGDHPPRSEAMAAAAIAEARGVPREHMILEETSTSTEENALRARELFGDGRVLIVTDGFHTFRAERVFRRYFQEVDSAASFGGPWVRIWGALREVAAIAFYGAAGRL